MVEERDGDMESAGTGPARAHATDEGPDRRIRDARDTTALNDRGQIDGIPDGSVMPSPIVDKSEAAQSATDDRPVLGDEGGSSRYGDDDYEDQHEGNEYSAPM